MNKLKEVGEKAKMALSSDKNTHDNTTATGVTGTTGATGHHNVGHSASTNAGPHDSNMANKADPRVDSDLDGSRNMGATSHAATHGVNTTVPGGATHHNAGVTSGHYANTGVTGTQNAGVANTNQFDNTRSSNVGPHNSNLLNKLDPRVDSDADGSRNMGAASHNNTATTGTHHAGHTQNAGVTGIGAGAGAGVGAYDSNRSTNAGPHDSNMANKMDPRIDSDMDGSRNMGAASNTATTGHSTHHYGTAGNTHNAGLANTTGHSTHHHGTAGNTHNAAVANTTGQENMRSSNVGPHSSSLMNKLDPRVDSDLDGSRKIGGGGASDRHDTHLAGHHPSMVDQADPTVFQNRGTYGGIASSGVEHTGAHGHGHGHGHHGTHSAATGPAANTAGPHKSDMLNKMDPRIDSDMNGARNPAGDHRNVAM